MSERLSTAERARDLPALHAAGWHLAADGTALRKVWRFRSFSPAWGFMSRVALASEKLNHHPVWSNRYDVVDVTLTSHDCGGLSALDVTLARRMDRLAGAEAEVVGDPSQPVASSCTPPATGG